MRTYQSPLNETFNTVFVRTEAATLHAPGAKLLALNAAELGLIEQITGCCSSLSATPSLCEEDEDLLTGCFDGNQDYTSTCAHDTISSEAVLQCISDYHGLCLSDESLDTFISDHESTASSVKFMMLHN